MVRNVSGDAGSIMTISSLHGGECGIEDVCLSSLSLIDYTVVKSIIAQELSDEEIKKLFYSARILKETTKRVDL